MIPVRHGPRLQGCEVGARTRFGIALRPIVLTRTDAREILVLLRRRPVVDDDRPDEMRAGRIVCGRAGAAAFEIEDIALHRRPAGAAMTGSIFVSTRLTSFVDQDQSCRPDFPQCWHR